MIQEYSIRPGGIVIVPEIQLRRMLASVVNEIKNRHFLQPNTT